MRIALLFLLWGELYAQSLNELLPRVAQSDLIEAMSYQTQSQEKTLASIKGAYLPKVTLASVYNNIPENQRSFVETERTYQAEASVVLFDGFRRHNTISAQKYSVEATKEQMLHTQAELELNTVKLFYGMLSIQAQQEAKAQKIKQLKQEVVRLERFFNAGQISQDVLEQIKTAYAMTQYEHVLLDQQYQEMQLGLEMLTRASITTLEPSSFKAPTITHEGTTHELKAADRTIEALYHSARTKTADYWPTLLLKDTFSMMEYYPMQMQGITLPTQANKIQVVAQMTLFDFFSKSNEKATALLQQKAKTKERDYKKLQLQTQQKLAVLTIKTSQQKLQAAEQSLISAQKSYDFIQKRFAARLVDNVTYLEALSSFTQAKALLESSKHDVHIAYANYYFQHGLPLQEQLQ